MEHFENDDGNFLLEGLSKKEAKKFKALLNRSLKSYAKKDQSISDQEWLKMHYAKALPSLSEEQAQKLASDTVASICEYDNNLASLNTACSKGQNSEQWFLEKVSEAAVGVSVIDYGNYLQEVNTALSNANAQMQRTVITNEETISNCYNLDGFIAEQYHVNQFNIQAALNKSNLIAEVCVPEAGHTYGLNSFDSVIKDRTTGKILHQYQFKFGKTAQSTIKYINEGNYNNQRIVVPAEQVEEVKKAFPSKSIEAYIGGTDKVPFKTEGLTKQQAKQMQLDTQHNNCIPYNGWDDFTTKELALSLGKNAGMAGLQAAAITTGFSLAARAVSGDPMDVNETVEIALKTGADSGLKAAATGAIQVGVEKGIFSMIPRETPVGIIANIACVGIENVKILAKVADNKISMSEAIDNMARTTTAMVHGIGFGAAGAKIGAAALSWVPVVGPTIGALAGSLVGYAGGSELADKIYEGGKKAVTVVKDVAVAAWEGVKSVGTMARNALETGWSGIKSIFGR